MKILASSVIFLYVNIGVMIVFIIIVKNNYKQIIEHKDEISGILDDSNSTFEKLVEESVELTRKMIEKIESGDWNVILKPWNLDTGLYTKVEINNNSIKLDFNNYESVWN